MKTVAAIGRDDSPQKRFQKGGSAPSEKGQQTNPQIVLVVRDPRRAKHETASAI